jgi:endonuclease-3
MHRRIIAFAGRLILHGRYTCKARRPECWRCPIRDLCRFKDKTADDGER